MHCSGSMCRARPWTIRGRQMQIVARDADALQLQAGLPPSAAPQPGKTSATSFPALHFRCSTVRAQS